MGTGKSGNYSGTYGSRNRYVFSCSTKQKALKGISALPKAIQSQAKSFFKGSSNSYTNYKVLHNKDKTFTIYMTKPGNVPGSKAVYHKVVGEDGKLLRVYKSTYDPKGNLVHVKEK